jgi:DNA-binding MarR family transcriptional regulator
MPSAEKPQGRRNPPFSPSIALLTVARGVNVAVDETLEAHGLTVRKYGVLGHIAATPGLSMSDLGRRSGITVQSVHTLIRSLVDAGLVASEVQGSGLAARITVTSKGTALLSRAAASVAELDEQLFTSTEMTDLSDALAAVVTARFRDRLDLQ